MTETSSIDVNFTSNGSNFDAEENNEEVQKNLNQVKNIDTIEEHIGLQETIKLLKENRLHDVDVKHLIEELESLNRRDKNKVIDILEQLIRHLLLLEYWEAGKQENKHHLRAEIQSFRSQLRRY